MELELRNRASALITAGTLVLLHRREADDFWALPGGRIEHGEDSLSTLSRELLEELSWHLGQADLACIAETKFGIADRYYLQIGFYFVAAGDALFEQQGRPKAYQELCGAEAGLIFMWVPRGDIIKMDVRPSAVMQRLVLEGPIRHVVQGF